MTGGAGTGAVGGNIVLGAFDLGPVRHDVTGAAKLARIIGEVSGADFYRMSKITMAGSLVGVAIQTADLGAVQPLTNGCQNNRFIKECAAVVVAESTVRSWATPCRASTSAALAKVPVPQPSTVSWYDSWRRSCR